MNVIVFDTETIGMISQDLINVGYKIIDINIQQANYKTLIQRDYIVTNLYNNVVYCMNDAFVGAKKYGLFEKALKEKTAVKRSLPQIFTTLENDLKRYKVLFGYAYNCNFDIDKFVKSAEKYQINNPIENLPVFDIWSYAYAFICDTEEYKQWAKDNNVLTETEKYINTSVESVCKYLYNNLEFAEDHTALSDVQHETNILIECIRRGCDITRPMNRAKYIASDRVFSKTIILPDGEVVQFEYTKDYTRGDRVIYKM